MAGFFNNYTKPGRGVGQDDYQSRPQIFFDVFFRKFWRLVQVNLMYVGMTLPLLASFYFFMPVGGDDGQVQTYLFWVGALLYLCVVGLGIVSPGFSYVLRNFARQEHAWVASDVIEHIRKNWKQGLLLMVIDTIAFGVIIFNYLYYTNVMAPSTLTLALRWAIVLIGIVYFMMHFYLYQIMVTVRLSMFQLLRSALVLTVAHLPKNLMILVLVTVIAFVTFALGVWPGLVLVFCFVPVLICFVVNFMVEPVIWEGMADAKESGE